MNKMGKTVGVLICLMIVITIVVSTAGQNNVYNPAGI
jgi:hypothetical protein